MKNRMHPVFKTVCLIFCYILLAQLPAQAQIGVDNTSPDPSSVLDLNATDKGLLIPRMTSAQRQAIVSPASSLLVFDTTVGTYFFYINGQWHQLTPWEQSSSNDDVYYNSGNVGIGTATPAQKLEVAGDVAVKSENSALSVDDAGNARLGFIKKAGSYPVIASDNGSPIIFSQSDQTGVHTNIPTATITERMRVDANGNVGIGTASPAYKLDVNGPVNTTAVYINGSPLSMDGSVPSGGIIMWSGSTASIPSGWVLCDGSNGTPDLRNRFIVGAGSTYGVGATGGQNSVALQTANVPSHTHSGYTAYDGTHSHTIYGETMQKDGTQTKSIKVLDTGTDPNHGNYNESTSSAGSHRHSFTTDDGTGSGAAFDVRPLYYALAYIMRL